MCDVGDIGQGKCYYWQDYKFQCFVVLVVVWQLVQGNGKDYYQQWCDYKVWNNYVGYGYFYYCVVLVGILFQGGYYFGGNVDYYCQ